MPARLPPFCLCLLLLLSGLAPGLPGAPRAAAQETRYFEELPDLPVMPGLAEAEAAGIAFDKPGGRIVTLYALGAPAPAAVRAFYAETLPALGWRPDGARAWRRAGERLTLETRRDPRVRDGATVARFTLAPE
ncbi:hypothetical protein AY600_13470 [Phormidium willei BDU 130791]|nr:hypothetical protein AY600_13470 [Phormidium willei BDU 130791]